MTPFAIARLDERTRRRWIDVEGCGVAWRCLGEGPPLVLLHGGHGSWLHWVRNVEALARAGHALWVPDMPGFGESDALPGDARAPDRLERLVAVLEQALARLLGPDTPLDIAGFSFGGLVASCLAAGRLRVHRLALLGPAGHRSQRRPRAALRDWRLSDRAAMLAALRHNLEAHMIADASRVDDLALAVHEASCVRTRFRSKEIALAASLPDVLGRTRVPVLTVFGEHDVTATPADAMASLARLGPQHHGVVEPDAGHWVQFERPEAVNARLAAWFAVGS
jgi:2-hydroxy-6-oxonona-2,4-dienedioate hydrolase